MHIYNTLSGKKERLARPKGRPLRLFVCGPTVYNYIHLGNARTYAVFDTLVRFLRSRGWDIFYLQNITDIDDKIIARAKAERQTMREVARRFEKEYHKDEKNLRIASVTRYARASAYIREIVAQIEILLKKEHAYRLSDGYYFDIATFPDYGKLAKRTLSQAEDGISRIDEHAAKRNRGDFALWKFPKRAEEPRWRTALGPGRPGWHIEDTAITERFFGPQYDLHGAAVDLIFPHHEAEIAQQESASGKKPMVKLWMHSEFLDMGGEKMSKSTGNFLTVRDFLAEHDANVFRFMVANHHYRTRINYDAILVTHAARSIATLEECLEKLKARYETREKQGKKRIALAPYDRFFRSALEDDLNTPRALAVLFDLVRTANRVVWNLEGANARIVYRFLQEKCGVFGIRFPKTAIPKNVAKLVRRRELYRAHQQFVQADALRNKTEQLGYMVEDGPIGPIVRRKSY